MQRGCLTDSGRGGVHGYGRREPGGPMSDKEREGTSDLVAVRRTCRWKQA